MNMTEEVNLLEYGRNTEPSAVLSEVRVSQDLLAVVPFTMDAVRVKLHYCPEPEIRSYVACTGNDCVLCKIGRHAVTRLLLPVYVPIERRVGVLKISDSMQSKALLPQLIAIWSKAQEENVRVIVFIKRQADNVSYDVDYRVLTDADDDGAPAIKQYLADIETDNGKLRSVVKYMTADQLRSVSSIADMLNLRGGH